MAFSYRNTLDSALSALPQRFSEQILADIGDKIEKNTKKSSKLFSFRTTAEVQELLADHGLDLSPIAFQNHSHPACKMIENHLLYIVLPNLLKNESSVGLMSLREDKTERFIKMRRFLKRGEFQNVKMFNASIDGKDFYRYGEIPSSNSLTRRLAAIKREYSNGFNARVMLMHDELHFHSPSDIMKLFESVEQLQTIVCTLVCPTELLVGETKSKNQRIYGFELVNDSLFFFPDNNPSEGYVQKVSDSRWPLENRVIIGEKMNLRVTVLHTIFAHHVVSIERTNLQGKREMFYKKPSCLLKSELALLSGDFEQAVIERKTMSSIMLYLSCLKSPNQESALAKLRQLERRELFQDEMKVIAAISSTFGKVKGWEDLTLSVTEKVKRVMCSNLPWLTSFFFEETVWKEIYSNFLSQTSVRWFRVDLGEIELRSVKSRVFAFRSTIVQPIRMSKSKDEVNEELPEEIKEHVGETCSVVDREGELKKIIEIAINTALPDDEIIADYDSENDVQLNTTDNATRNQVAHIAACDIEDSIPMSFKPDRVRKNSCVVRSVAQQMSVSADELLSIVYATDLSDNLLNVLDEDEPMSVRDISELACLIGKNIRCLYDNAELSFGVGQQLFIKLSDGHCEPMEDNEIGSLMEEKTSLIDVPALDEVIIELSSDAAVRLGKSLCRGTTGVLVKEVPEMKKKVEETCKVAKKISKTCLNLRYMWGAPGSGKTRGLIKFLKEHDEASAMIISPRRLLADDWEKQMKNSGNKVCTFETFYNLDTRRFNMVVIDEMSLMPPGSIDLIFSKIICDRLRRAVSGVNLDNNKIKKEINCVKREVRFMAIGDPMQARYYSDKDSMILAKVHDIDRLTTAGACKTLWKTHRMGRWFKKFFDIQSLRTTVSDNDEFKVYAGFSAISKERKYDAILCASQEDKKMMIGQYPVYTFGEAQGLTFQRTLIALTSDLQMCNDHHMFVGLTRSIEQFDFVYTSNKSLREYMSAIEKKLIGMVINGVMITRERLSHLFRCQRVQYIEEDRFGACIQSKSGNDPFIQPFCYLGETIEVEGVMCEEEDKTKEHMKCHIPIASFNPLQLDVYDRVRLKESREAFKDLIGYSDQFIDTDKGLKHSLMGCPMRMESIFPRHKGDDNVTFLMAVKKRLRFSNPTEESNLLRANSAKGQELADFFLRSLPHKFEITVNDVEEAEVDFIKKRCEKDTARWINHVERSDIDWPINKVMMFMKSQLCTKYEKMYCDAKAGQTLACFSHIVLFKMGPIIRAVEKGFSRACGKNFYIHSSKNFDELNNWVVENGDLFKNGKSIESDYEAFDSSQDSLVLAFEVALMARIGVPGEMIKDYTDLKVNLGSKLGNFSIMRFTGEFCTFLFNTFSNMLFTMLKYDVRKGDRILFAGDDMASIGPIYTSKNKWKVDMLENFRLKAKEERKDNPLFCGWCLTPDGIYKLPELLWARINVMKEKGLIRDCIDSYLLELKYGFDMSESLFNYLDERQTEFHYCAVRFFIENSRLCRGESIKVLKRFGLNFGSMKFDGWSPSQWVTKSLNAHVNGARKMAILSNIKMAEQEKCLTNKAKLIDMIKENRLIEDSNHERKRELDHLKSRMECRKKEYMLRQMADNVKLAEFDKGSLPSLGYDFSLKKEKERVKTEKEGECQLSKLMKLSSDLGQTALRSMRSKMEMCMVMPASFIQKSWDVSGGLNPMLKSQLSKQMELFCQNSLWLIKQSQNGYLPNLQSLVTYTSERSLCASAHLCQIMKKLKEWQPLLTQQCMNQRWPTSLVTKLTLGRGLVAFWYGQLIACRPLTPICNVQYRLLSGLKEYTVMLAGRLLQLMLALYTGWRTLLDSYHRNMVGLDGISRKLLELKEKNLTCLSLRDFGYGTVLRLSQWTALQGEGKRASCKEGQAQEKGSTEPKPRVKPMEERETLVEEVWGNLGLPLLEPKEESLKQSENMSLKEVIRGEVRSRVMRHLWVTFVDPGHDLIAQGNLPALPAMPEGENLEIYNTVMDGYLCCLYGNIAILGTSAKVVWPDVNVPVPAVQFITAAGNEINWEGELNLHEVCPSLDMFKRSHANAIIKGCTARTMAEPFAGEAKRFLFERRLLGVSTNIYEKWPRAFENAPWVAFDFAAGLNLSALTADERSVIDKMTKRLFRTEGQKMVFNAQGEVNFTLEG